ncbi:hypothetical protein ABZ766_18515 [Streptomyces sp. NPDC006670]|uniref:hypothetical protein n=1 Tax=Streptomyces sp. NPDC006670 TaxID=3154476 RepID=UPI0033EFEC34
MATPPDTEPPFLTLHTAVVLLGALFAGFAAGGLSYLGGVPVPLAVLAGLGAAGSAVPGLRGLIR